MIRAETKEVENDNPDRCDVCKRRLTANQTCETESRSTHLTTRRNPSRSAKRNYINQHCWKCSEVQPLKVETETLTMEDQSEPPSAGHLQSDALGKSSTKRFKCGICDKMFTQRGNLDLHIRTVHDKVRAFPCPQCPYKATQKGSLEMHILTHTRETNFKCDICDKKFTRSGNLKLHIRTVHDKVRAFPCPHCSYTAKRKNHLETHILKHAGEKNFTREKNFIREKNFKCDICDKKFTLIGNLKAHIRTVHEKAKPFPCPLCPFKATQNGHLQEHIRAHTGEKNFKCDICDKKFTRSGNLKLHIRTVHDMVRAFSCPRCLYTAKRKSHLETHILTHTREKNFIREKNFKCDICDKKFLQRSRLKLHIRTVHDKVRAFPCPHCPYKAAYSSHLQNHIFTHTGEKNFKCDICDKKFTRNSVLNKHIRTVHDKDNNTDKVSGTF